jgi:hypothetical protein
MANVTIVGTMMPCTQLRRGETRTVQHSDHVQRLIDRGFVEVVEWHDDDEAGLTAGKSGERTASNDMPPPDLPPDNVNQAEVSSGTVGTNTGQPNPMHVAPEGADKDSPVDPPNQKTPRPRLPRRPRKTADTPEQ